MDPLPILVERNLSRVIEKEFEFCEQVECLRQELATSQDYHLERLFAVVDDCLMTWIDTNSLKRFLVKCRMYPNQRILTAAVRRMDLNGNARISFKEFTDFIQPMENFTKESLARMKTASA
jgi:Ca2+-binding EF-hand superfamily protein